MNDFTKEELQIILDSIDAIGASLNVYNKKLGSLCKKVSSMIENYCDHINDQRFNIFPLPGNPKLCEKCERFYI